MCGIAGIWGRTDLKAVQRMIEKIDHRGPDGSGYYVRPGKGVLGHARLAIMDPDGGHQPLYNEEKNVVVVANGEIYNHQQLRQRLSANHDFTTKSDNETIVHLFEELGVDVVEHLDGMFAFAVADGDDLFLARDPLGIKPLYYGFEHDGSSEPVLYFASELKAISEWTDDVYELPPGNYYHSRIGFQTYYTVPEHNPQQTSLAVLLSKIRQTLESAVVKRLMSDVPLGAFLSGGLDSSIVAAIARQHMDELHTFTVGTEKSSDIEAARIVSKHLGTIHHEYIVTPAKAMEKLPEVIYHYESSDQELVRSSIATYFCARMAVKHVKVILTGEGSDELFAGYPYYRGITDQTLLHQELRRSVMTMDNVMLQRVDRLTMGHGLEARVPFLDLAMVELAQLIPPHLKLYRPPSGKRIEKWILRKAFEDLLPPEIVWRDKIQFDEGVGMPKLLEIALQPVTEHIDLAAYREQFPNTLFRTEEECFYHQVLCDVFDHPEAVLKNVGHWAVTPFHEFHYIEWDD